MISRFAHALAVPLLLFATAMPAQTQTIALPGVSAPKSEPAKNENETAPIPLKSPDQEIQTRLKGLFSEIDGLQTVRPRVKDGIVTLTGTTLTVADQTKAEAIASRLAGVVSVENALVAEHRVSRRLEPLIDKSEQMLRDTLAFLPLLLVALLIFLGFWYLGRFLTRNTRIFRRLAPNAFIETLLRQAVRTLLMLIGLVLAMSVLGATALLGSILGAAGVLGLAVGFAVRDTIENYIASILLSVRQPFAPNDHVIIEGYEGKITRLNSRATMLTSFDGNEVRIPNATVYKANIVNFTHTPDRRFLFEVGIGYENDISEALALALAVTKDVDGVLAQPGPFTLVDRLDAYTVVIKVFGWVNQSKSDFGKVKSETIRRVKEAFDAHDISIPAPIQNVHEVVEHRLPQAVPDALPPPPKPAVAEKAAVCDTSADTTIDEKVEAERTGDGEDLLTRNAPRE